MGFIAWAKVAFVKAVLMKYDMDTPGGALLLDTFVKEYKKHDRPYREIHHIHKQGFSCSDWDALSLTDENCRRLLSTAQYYLGHPYNGRYSPWIDDKLTLKYMCHGTKADFLPKYYFQIDNSGSILYLMDCPEQLRGTGLQALCKLLQTEGDFAAKPYNSSGGAGFFKISCHDGEYTINGRPFSEEDFCAKISDMKGYIFTEWLRPHPDLAKYCPNTINSIRYLVIKRNGKLISIDRFIRFGTKNSGFIDNAGAGGVFALPNQDGQFSGGFIGAIKEDSHILFHPDSGVPLDGTIPLWDKLQEAAEIFSETFPQLSFMGFDFAVTDKNEIKIIEINSLSDSVIDQHDFSFLDGEAGEFFREKSGEVKRRKQA